MVSSTFSPARFGAACILALTTLHFSAAVDAKPNANKKTPDNSSARSEKASGEQQWFLRTHVSARDVAGTSFAAVNPAVLGYLADSSDAYDRHDIQPYRSVAADKVGIAFVQNDWGERSGEYLSDFRGKNPMSTSWMMTVTTQVAGAKVTVSWDPLHLLQTTSAGGPLREVATLDHKLLERLTLVDTVTLQTRPAVSDGKLNSYTFNLLDDEQSRNLLWVLGPVSSRYFEPGSHAKQYIQQQQQRARRETGELTPDKNAHPVFGLPPG